VRLRGLPGGAIYVEIRLSFAMTEATGANCCSFYYCGFGGIWMHSALTGALDVRDLAVTACTGVYNIVQHSCRAYAKGGGVSELISE
jgi:hypothetical protein